MVRRSGIRGETAREARAEAARIGADCAIAIGGGSTVGLAAHRDLRPREVVQELYRRGGRWLAGGALER